MYKLKQFCIKIGKPRMAWVEDLKESLKVYDNDFRINY